MLGLAGYCGTQLFGVKPIPVRNQDRSSVMFERLGDACIYRGDSVRVINKSDFAGDSRKDYGTFTSKGRYIGPHVPCLIPAYSDQDISLESVVGVTADSTAMENLPEAGAELMILPSFPEVLTPDFYFISVSVEGKDVPLSYLKKRAADDAVSRPYVSLDIRQLYEDGLLTGKDLSDDLEVRISSHLSIHKPPSVGELQDLVRDSDYSDVRDDFSSYLRPSKMFPSNDPKIRKIVDSFPGQRPELLNKIRYALVATSSSLHYLKKELDLDPVTAMKVGLGDCDDFARVFGTITNAFGIPTRAVGGAIIDNKGNYQGMHMWVEVLLPVGHDGYRWIMVEPTGADDVGTPSQYIGFPSKRHVYSVDFDIAMKVRSGKYTLLQAHDYHSR